MSTVKAIPAVLEANDRGGFTAIASTGQVDRDGEIVAPGCFNPLPASVPVHVDHNLTVAGLVGRGRPYYVGNELRIDATFNSTPEAQSARQKAVDGSLDSMSIVFRGITWRQVDGVRTCTDGDLLAADLVTIPSNVGARVLAVRGGTPVGRPAISAARKAVAAAMVSLAESQLAEVRASNPAGPARRRVDEILRDLQW